MYIFVYIYVYTYIYIYIYMYTPTIVQHLRDEYVSTNVGLFQGVCAASQSDLGLFPLMHVSLVGPLCASTQTTHVSASSQSNVNLHL